MILQNTYLSRYGFKKILFNEPPEPDLNILVVIPSYNEPDLMESIKSLTGCHPPTSSVEIIVIINDKAGDAKEVKSNNLASFQQCQAMAKHLGHPRLRIYPHYESEIRGKDAGVGMVRKIGMDEAVRRLELIGNQQGIIACFDADCVCDDNYFIALESSFKENHLSAASIYFEHPLEGTLAPDNYEGVIWYEIYLRYYINALRWAKYPYAYHTVGSSLAVRSDVYQKQGGMNKRKAGEDFYFVHKLIPLGNYGEINDTRVVPSPRLSLRVPFGTGKALSRWTSGDYYLKNCYNPQSFKDLSEFISMLDGLFKIKGDQLSPWRRLLSPCINEFLDSQNFEHKIKEINSNCGPEKVNFYKRFFNWLNGFKVLKYLHFAREHFYPDVETLQASRWLLKNVITNFDAIPENEKELLLKMRSVDKMGWKQPAYFEK